MKRVYITGNIGTGKSTVAKIFAEDGFKIISADEISAEILKYNHVRISKLFSMPPQKFDEFKKRLGNMVFSGMGWPNGQTYKELLEEFMLPRIKEEIEIQVKKADNQGQKFVIEAPTYFETNGLSKNPKHFIIMVHADKDIRVNRILERNKHLSIQDVLDRMKSQIDPSKKIEFCDEVIWNNGSYDELAKEVKEIKLPMRTFWV